MERPKPLWLDDEPAIAGWLHAVLDRLDKMPGEERSEPLRFKAMAILFPGPVCHGPEVDERWVLIKALRNLLPLRITLARCRDQFAHEYEGARLALDAACEQTLRDWLQRPRCAPAKAAWLAAVERADAPWPWDGRERLRARPVEIAGCDADTVVAAFVRLGEWCGQGLTLRQMSARVFFGDSKFLDGREALVAALYPERPVAPRPLLVAVSLPAVIEGVLFIENQDTYVRALAGRYAATAGLALVYAAGFKGGAARIREAGNAVMHYAGCCDGSVFERWWFRTGTDSWPVWFWGDLDFDGMRILKGLREQFGARAWEAGYAPLVSILRSAGGHLPIAAEKENQRAPEATGCAYADGVLLPALERHGRFVDQEAW